MACRKTEYEKLCKYLNVEYDERDDDKEFYYNSLFDDIRVWFNEYCESNIGVKEETVYGVIRYITVNIYRYIDLLLSAREWTEEDSGTGDFWIDRLWNEGYKDYRNEKKGYVAWN